MSTLIGIFFGILFLFIAFTSEGGSVVALLMPAPMLIVIGGTLAATLAGSRWKVFWEFPKYIKEVIGAKEVSRKELAEEILSIATLAKREGILKVEDVIENTENKFLRKLLIMAVDGVEKENYIEICHSDLDLIAEIQEEKVDLFHRMGGFSPTMGIIGTVMGLINTLASAGEDPNVLIHQIAFAFIATLWGIAMANLVFLPIADKLKVLHSNQMQAKQMMVNGVYGIICGEIPRVLASRLNIHTGEG